MEDPASGMAALSSYISWRLLEFGLWLSVTGGYAPEVFVSCTCHRAACSESRQLLVPGARTRERVGQIPRHNVDPSASERGRRHWRYMHADHMLLCYPSHEYSVSQTAQGGSARVGAQLAVLFLTRYMKLYKPRSKVMDGCVPVPRRPYTKDEVWTGLLTHSPPRGVHSFPPACWN